MIAMSSCPFCRRDSGRLRCSPVNESPRFVQADCEWCGASDGVNYKGETEAVAAWNRRAGEVKP